MNSLMPSHSRSNGTETWKVEKKRGGAGSEAELSEVIQKFQTFAEGVSCG